MKCVFSAAQLSGWKMETSQTLTTFMHGIIKMHVPIATVLKLVLHRQYEWYSTMFYSKHEIHSRCFPTGSTRMSSNFPSHIYSIFPSYILSLKISFWQIMSTHLHASTHEIFLCLDFHQDHLWALREPVSISSYSDYCQKCRAQKSCRCRNETEKTAYTQLCTCTIW